MTEDFYQNLYKKIETKESFSIDITRVDEFMEDLLRLFFPERCTSKVKNSEEMKNALNACLKDLKTLLCKTPGFVDEGCEGILNKFINYLPSLIESLRSDVEFIASHDPAAESVAEVIVCYPGFYGIYAHRLAHFFYQHNVRILPRLISESAHSLTGIDIHPGATIGCPFLIDHGTGVVIGETTVIGRRVRLFQSVTLGALSLDNVDPQIKRHPTVGDDCIIYANATILGGDTHIGEGSVIGGSVWLTESVPPHSKVYHTPIIKVRNKKKVSV